MIDTNVNRSCCTNIINTAELTPIIWILLPFSRIQHDAPEWMEFPLIHIERRPATALANTPPSFHIWNVISTVTIIIIFTFRGLSHNSPKNWMSFMCTLVTPSKWAKRGITEHLSHTIYENLVKQVKWMLPVKMQLATSAAARIWNDWNFRFFFSFLPYFHLWLHTLRG